MATRHRYRLPRRALAKQAKSPGMLSLENPAIIRKLSLDPRQRSKGHVLEGKRRNGWQQNNLDGDDWLRGRAGVWRRAEKTGGGRIRGRHMRHGLQRDGLLRRLVSARCTWCTWSAFVVGVKSRVEMQAKTLGVAVVCLFGWHLAWKRR